MWFGLFGLGLVRIEFALFGCFGGFLGLVLDVFRWRNSLLCGRFLLAFSVCGLGCWVGVGLGLVLDWCLLFLWVVGLCG